MSRGLGKVERNILAHLEGRKLGTIASDLAYMHANDWSEEKMESRQSCRAARTHLVSVRRAIHNLAQHNMVEAVRGRIIPLNGGGQALGVRLPSQEWPRYFISPERDRELEAKWRAIIR